MRVFKCEDGHFSILSDASKDAKCTICGKDAKDFAEYMEGDCVACGQLCPSYAYCCATPQPYKNSRKEHK